MKRFVRSAVLCLCCLFAAGTPAQKSPPTFTTFEVPGAGTGAAQGTIADGINTTGTIAGSYTDSSGVVHGFVRAASGAITTFDAPGTGTGGCPQGTFASSINTEGAIAGYSVDARGDITASGAMPAAT